ncbi:MAG TPA: hypothetical protein VJB14_12185 [Planctomycetota bacterium]|nr:hypothetical protein [Planctomycetota bacterium]
MRLKIPQRRGRVVARGLVVVREEPSEIQPGRPCLEFGQRFDRVQPGDLVGFREAQDQLRDGGAKSPFPDGVAEPSALVLRPRRAQRRRREYIHVVGVQLSPVGVQGLQQHLGPGVLVRRRQPVFHAGHDPLQGGRELLCNRDRPEQVTRAGPDLRVAVLRRLLESG